jgi:hypothetical protein
VARTQGGFTRQDRSGNPFRFTRRPFGADPDFAAADTFAAERQRELDQRIASRVAAEHAVASNATQSNDQRDRDKAAVERLSQLDEKERLALAAAAVAACEYQHFAPHIAA